MDTLKTIENQLKATTVLLGLFSSGFTGASSYAFSKNDSFALAMVVIAWLFSIILLVLILLKQLPSSASYKKIEAIIFLVLTIILIIAFIVFIINIFEGFDGTNQFIRIIAAIFQFANILAFGWISIIVFKHIKK